MARRPSARVLVILMTGLVALALAGGLGGVFWRQPRFAVRTLADLNPDVFFQLETDELVVALTIDDGPHRSITPGVLDLLGERELRLTFFVLGEHIAGNEDLLARMRDEGHEIGNHLVEDRPSIMLSDEEFERQMLAVDPWIDPEAPQRWLRPGSGWFDADMVELAGRHGYRLCLGSIFPHDDKFRDPQWLAGQVLDRVHPGAVIILHDGAEERAGLLETLPLVLDGLADLGYEVVTVSELAAHRP